MALTDVDVKALEEKAEQIRETIITMLVAAGSGHTAGPLDMADIFAAFYSHILKQDPKNPDWPERDRLILSNGHIVPVRYAAMAHAGICLVGAGSLTPQGIAGSIYHAYAQGIALAALFLLVGALEHRVGLRDVMRFGGLASEIPVFSSVFGVALLASMGVPGLAGFWGELLAIMGAFPNNRATPTPLRRWAPRRSSWVKRSRRVLISSARMRRGDCCGSRTRCPRSPSPSSARS